MYKALCGLVTSLGLVAIEKPACLKDVMSDALTKFASPSGPQPNRRGQKAQCSKARRVCALIKVCDVLALGVA